MQTELLCDLCDNPINEDDRYCRRCGEFVEGYIPDEDPPLSPAVAELAQIYAGKMRARDAMTRADTTIADVCDGMLARQGMRPGGGL